MKAAIKDLFNCEFNTSLKSNVGQTKYVGKLWLSHAPVLQKVLAGIDALNMNLYGRVSAVQSRLGDKACAWVTTRLLAIAAESEDNGRTGLGLGKEGHALQILSNLVSCVGKFKELLQLEAWTSVVNLCHKFQADVDGKKKKATFKLGEGSLALYTTYLNSDSLLAKLFPIPDFTIKKAEPSETEMSTEKPDPSAHLNSADSQYFAQQIMNVYNEDSWNNLKELLETQNQEHRIPKIAKGTRDCQPQQMAIRSYAIDRIKAIFLKHGAVEIDTPVFELKETLMGKYGEEGGKLIYDLKDQGGELLSLRYDLTVPFARFMVTNNFKKIKRFAIAKVYRRDQPNITKGRFREFYQCDFDIAGPGESMIADAEVLKIVCEILDTVNVSEYVVKINHRLLLEAMIELSGVPLTKFRSVCSSIDKLDKEPWAKIKEELINEKGISPTEADSLGKFVHYSGPITSLITEITSASLFADNPSAHLALTHLTTLAAYLQDFNCYKNITLDFSLARGLDYYTGVIYEAILVGAQVGSIAGGGRYDDLIGMFGTTKVNSVGVSIGIERMMVLLEEKEKNMRTVQTEVLVATLGKDLLNTKLRLVNQLWEKGIKTEYLYEGNPRADKQMSYA
jgi:histidyl-tRNA synthetase